MKLYQIVTLMMIAAIGSQANALQADREKPIEIFAQHFIGDEVNQKATYTGDVEVHQGTLDIRGTKLDIVIDPEGYRTVTIIGKPVQMKEKRDNADKSMDEWTHMRANKAVYREKNSTIVFSDSARFFRTENGTIKDATSGDVITYDLLHATTSVQRSATRRKNKERVSTVLTPRKNNAAAANQKKQTPQKKTDAPNMRQSMTLRLD